MWEHLNVYIYMILDELTIWNYKQIFVDVNQVNTNYKNRSKDLINF